MIHPLIFGAFKLIQSQTNFMIGIAQLLGPAPGAPLRLKGRVVPARYFGKINLITPFIRFSIRGIFNPALR